MKSILKLVTIGLICSGYFYVAQGLSVDPPMFATLSGNNVNVSWTEEPDAIEYELNMGTEEQGDDLYNGEKGTDRSAYITGLPTNGMTIHVDVIVYKVSEILHNVFTYTAYFSPNFLKAIQHAHDKDDPNITIPSDNGYVHLSIVNTDYFDGLSRRIQSHLKFNDNASYDALINGEIYDNVANKVKIFLSFPYTTAGEFVPTDLEIPAKAYYSSTGGGPDADGYPYDFTIYYPDPLNRIKGIGKPGKPFSLDETDGNPIKMWYFGITGINNPATYFDSNGFILSTYLKESNYEQSLETDIPASLDAIVGQPNVEFKYFLTVIRDPNGNFRQEIKDINDKVLRNWYDLDPDVTGEEIVGKQTYDINGNLIDKEPLEAGITNTAYTNNTLGQATSKTTADAGTVKFIYDKAGRLRFRETQKQRDKNAGDHDPFFVYNYDAFGRNTTTAILDNPLCPIFTNLTGETDISSYIDVDHYHVKCRNIYDNPLDALDYIEFSTITLAILNSLEKTRARVVATITYSEDCEGKDERECRKKVVVAFSYDNEGRVKRKYTSVPGLLLHIVEFSYDLQGKILSDVIKYGNNDDIITENSYNEEGKIKEVKVNDKKFVTYQYDDLNRLTSKFFWNHLPGQQGQSQEITYDYNIRGWTKQISAGNFFSEDLRYIANVDDPQYIGNIARITINQNVDPATEHQEIDCYFKYDRVDRLKESHNKATLHPDDDDDAFDASFTYDKSGRFITKNEGLLPDGVGGMKFNDWGDYSYIPTTNKLGYIENSDRGQTGTLDNFIYDPNGNMVLDRSKKMAVTYNWKDLPITFSFYNTIPADVTSFADVQALDQNPDAHRLSRVKMMYDASGNRVLKQLFK